MSKPKTDKRVNPEYDKPQSIYRDGVTPEDALRKLLEAKAEAPKK